MSQETQILNHLKRKPLTAMEALQQFGCFRLAARILDLRDSGHNIQTDTIHKGGKHYAQYTLK